MRGEIGDDDGNDREQQEGRDIGRIGDGEGVDGWQEEVVVAERCRHGRQERRPEPVADGDPDNGRQETRSTFSTPSMGLRSTPMPRAIATASTATM